MAVEAEQPIIIDKGRDEERFSGGDIVWWALLLVCSVPVVLFGLGLAPDLGGFLLIIAGGVLGGVAFAQAMLRVRYFTSGFVKSMLSALQAPAAEDRAVGDGQKAGIAQDADLLAVAEAAAMLACTARIRRERQCLDPQRKSRFGELDRQVLRVRHDVNGVRPVSPGPAARAAAEDLAHQIRLAVCVESVKAGVADGLLVGRHAAAGGLGQHASQDP